jgi:hypothetical protein
MGSSGGEMEVVRCEKRMEERNKRVVAREERMRKVEKEKEKAEKENRAARVRELYAKAVEGIQMTLKGTGEPKEPWEQFRDHWMEVWGEGGHFGEFEDKSK